MRLVAVHQRLHQHLGDLFGRQVVEPAGAALALLALLLLHLAPQLVDVGVVVAAGQLVLAGRAG